MYVVALCSTQIPVFSKHSETLHSTLLPLSVLSYLLITINKAGGCLAPLPPCSVLAEFVSLHGTTWKSLNPSEVGPDSQRGTCWGKELGIPIARGLHIA